MALILDNYDLSNGATYSSVVTDANIWRVSAITSGCPGLQQVVCSLEVKGENGEFYAVEDNSRSGIKILNVGNETKGANALAVNGKEARVRVVPIGKGASGFISIDSVNG